MTFRHPLTLIVAVLLAAGAGRAEASQADPERSALETTLDLDVLNDLPTSANIFSVLETTLPEVISDRFYSGGLHTGQPARLGAFLASSSQTLFRVGDVNVTAPDGSGTPFLFPELLFWQRVHVVPGLMPDDINASGLAVSLEPRKPAERWIRIFEGSGSAPGWVSQPSPTGPPAIARLDTWAHGTAVLSGPAIPNRLGLVLAASWTRASQFEREGPAPLDGTVGSAFAHVVFTPTSRDEVRTLGWVQRARYPFADRQSAAAARDASVHAQSVWERHSVAGATWRLFGGYTQRDRMLDAAPAVAGMVVERLRDGPVPELVDQGASASRRWSIGGRFAPRARVIAERRHARAGIDFERATGQTGPAFSGRIGELVDGIPARIWRYSNAGIDSHRHATMVAAYASDEIELGPRTTLAAGLRYDAVTGAAEGAATDVSWQSWLPHASLRWRVTQRARIGIFGGYARSAYRLPLGLLAYGDPAAPVADVFRWNAPLAAPAPLLTALGPLVARVGPGPGGNAAFSSINPNLKRPYTDELTIGAESRPAPALRLQIAGIARWEKRLVALINSGVSVDDYSTVNVRDPGVDPAHAGDQTIPVYNLLPANFGRDRYELTNPSLDIPTLVALDISVQASTSRLFLLIGGTAQRAVAPAGNRGFHRNENDQGVIGELLTDPNAFTYARGRPFTDRAYTGNVTVVYRFPKDVRLGAIARYQDGQPFAGLVVVPDLNQGAEAVRAYANGGTRFTYTGTLDVRLQKGFGVGAWRLDAVIDAYNLINLGNEVEERTVVGPGFRSVTAIQPPRMFHLGARVTF